jgi:hypothetical protein
MMLVSSAQSWRWLALAVAVLPAYVGTAAAAPAGIDGLYTVGESDLQGTKCSDTPFRAALAPQQTGPNYGYEVRVVTSAGGTEFLAPGGGTAVFSVAVDDDGSFTKEDGAVRVDGSFGRNSRGEMAFTMEWIHFEAGGATTCTTQFSARQTSAAAPAPGSPPATAPVPVTAPAASPPASTRIPLAPPPVPFVPITEETGPSGRPAAEPLSEPDGNASTGPSTVPPTTGARPQGTRPPTEEAVSGRDADGGDGSLGPVLALAGVTVGTAVVVTWVNGRRVRRKPKFKPRRKTERGASVFDPTEDQQRRRWNEDQQVWDPETYTYRPARPDDLVEEAPLVPAAGVRAEDVPPTCRPLYDLYAVQSDQQQWLVTAIKESEARHQTLEQLFVANKARALLQMAAPIVEAAVGLGTAGVGAARGSLLRAGSTAAGNAARARTAARLDDAMARRARMWNTGIEADPAVARARALHTLYENKTRSAELNLPKAAAARARLEEMDAVAANLRRKQGQAYFGKRPAGFPDDPDVAALPNRAALEQQISRIKDQIESLERPLEDGIRRVEAELADVRRRLRINDEGTLGGRKAQTGKVGAQAYAAEAREQLVWRQNRLHGELAELRSKLSGDQIRNLDDRLRAAEAELRAHPGWDELVIDETRATREANRALRTTWQLDDVTDAEVVQLRQLRDDAHFQLTVARTAARERFDRELRMVNHEIDGLQKQLERLDVPPPQPSGPVRLVQTLMAPVGLLMDRLIGSGDSPEEIIRILLENKKAVLEEQAALNRARLVHEEWSTRRVPASLARLQACMQAGAPLGPGGAP